MIFNNVYIISWFGNNPELISKRMKFHDNQLKWCFNAGLKPIVFAQEYKKEYYRDNVTYIVNDNALLRPGQARDILLKHFYSSDDDFAIFVDNDTYLYQGAKYGHNDRIVEIMRNTDISKFELVDMFYPINPAYVPFSKDLEKHKEIDKNNLRMKPGFHASGMFFLKNIRKYHSKEIYYDNNFVLPDNSMLPAEDQDFPINLISNNMSCFACPNLIKKDEGHNSVSTWSPTDRDLWKEKTIAGHNYIANKYNLPKVVKLLRANDWMPILKTRNHKLANSMVSFGETTFDLLFKE